MTRAVVLAHYDPDGIIDPSVVRGLQVYRAVADRLVVVSASARSLPAEAASLADEFLPRDNVGYDFGSWRDGLSLLGPLDRFDEVICVNDSAYGPFADLGPVLADPRVAAADFWGMIRSAQRGDHLQSWFLAFRRPVLTSPAFARFWEGVVPQPSKEGVIDGVQAILYTHDHVDHVYGLDDIRPICYRSGGPVPVYCEERVERRIRRAFDYAFETMPVPGGGVPKIAFERITTAPCDILGARVVPLRLRHGVFDVLGFRFGNVAYCTDTNLIPDETWPLLGGLDTLILDCLRPERHPTHLSLDEAIAVAGRVAARRTLFVHMSHDIEHAAVSARLPAGVELAYDGLTIPLS